MEPFKNNLSAELVTCISDHLARHLPAFDRRTFETSILRELDVLELKERAQLIANRLHEVLPNDLIKRNRIIAAMLHPNEDQPGDQQSDDRGICGWGMMPLGIVVGQHGIAAFDDSLALIAQMTSRFSSEFEVRYFLLADQQRALDIIGAWVHSPDYHIRRLVSEGTRPRLPWAMQLPSLMKDPTPILPLLKALRDDETEYIRRSVANSLNDIAKDHPELVADIAEEWLVDAGKNRLRLIKHACRTLIKQGHRRTLNTLGYGEPEVALADLKIATPTVNFGESLIFDISLVSTAKTTQNLMIDYAIHHRKANGKTSPKVFKWKYTSLKPGAKLVAERKHPLKKITTRKYYGGAHRLETLINGISLGVEEFELQNV